MTTAVLRPGHRLHWLSWIVAGVLTWSAVTVQCEQRLIVGFVGLIRLHTQSAYGWPTYFLHETKTETAVSWVPVTYKTEYEYAWNLTGIGIDVFACLAGLAATIFLMESHVRSNKLGQFTLQQLLLWTVTAGLLLGTSGMDSVLPRYIVWFGARFDLTKLIYWPLLLGLICIVHSLVWLTWRALILLGRLCFPRPFAAPPSAP
jgi:hypothetical protein